MRSKIERNLIEFNKIYSSIEQTNLACDILSICMSNLAIGETENNYYLERSLMHTNYEVNLLGLKEMHRMYHKNVNIEFNSNLVIAAVQCVGSDNIGVSSAAIFLLRDILPKSMDDKGVIANLDQMLHKSSIVACRVYELSNHLALLTEEFLPKIEFILVQLIADMHSDDALLLVSSLDFLSEFASTNYGMIYLEKKHVLSRIKRNIQTLDQHPMRTLLIPAYMKFFGFVGAAHPEKIIIGFPQMITSLLDCILDANAATLPIAFDTLCKFAKYL